MTRRRRLLKGIREKLVLSFSLLIACIAAFVFVFFPTRLERQAMRAMSAKASAIRDMTSYSLSAGLFFADHAAVREVLAGAARAGDVVFLAVHDAEGGRVAAVGSVPLRGIQPSRTRTAFVSPDGGTFITASPVVHGVTRIGSLTVGISLAELREEVANARRLGALVGSLIFLVGLFMIFAISTLVTRPLKAVSDTVRRISAGDLHLRAAETSDAEVAQFVQSFNHMVDGLARAQSELSAINQELEARVDARTAQLLSAIADQRSAQEALAQSESQARGTSEMLQSLIDVAPQAIIALDLGWRVTRWNRAAERLFGWTAGEVIGMALPNVPEDQRSQFERLDERLANDEKASAEEVIRLRKDGTRVSVLRAISALSDSTQNRVGYIGVFTDLTERKSLEAQLRQSQKMEAIGRLAGGVAHDFNNMLTVITSCAAMLLDRVEGAEERADLEEISAAATRASALTRQLLLFSRRQVVHRQPVNISDTVGNMVPMLRRLLRENIQFTTALAGSIGTVTADPTQLEQVIMNLVVNASDAMPEGGSLTVETQNVELDEIYANHHADVTPGQYVMLVVSDTGIGMDASTVSKIFEPFFTTKEAGKGTGLGLATTYAVVSQLGGHIRVYSEPGHGAAFKIYLPRETAEAETRRDEAAHVQPERSSAVRETILLVEDEDIVRRAIRRTLEQHGYHVLEAADGESGLATAAAYEGEIHAVVTDLMMPGMNGRSFIDLLHSSRTGFRVVFMSGYTDETVNQRGLVDSTHTFLQKPFSGAQLSQALNDLMHESPVAAR